MNTASFARNTINRIPLSFLPMRRRRFIQPTANHFQRHVLHTFSRHQPLWDAYEKHIPLKDRYCLHQLEKDWEQHKPLKGKTVLVNMHLTRLTLAW